MPIRKIAAVTLAVSFLAMSTSGMMMFVIEKPSFTIQMHPVHKLFGLLMIISAVAHIFYNYRSLLNHLRSKPIAVYGCVLVVCLVLLYGFAAYNRVPPEFSVKMDEAAEQAH